MGKAKAALAPIGARLRERIVALRASNPTNARVRSLAHGPRIDRPGQLAHALIEYMREVSPARRHPAVRDGHLAHVPAWTPRAQRWTLEERSIRRAAADPRWRAHVGRSTGAIIRAAARPFRPANLDSAHANRPKVRRDRIAEANRLRAAHGLPIMAPPAQLPVVGAAILPGVTRDMAKRVGVALRATTSAYVPGWASAVISDNNGYHEWKDSGREAGGYVPGATRWIAGSHRASVAAYGVVDAQDPCILHVRIAGEDQDHVLPADWAWVVDADGLAARAPSGEVYHPDATEAAKGGFIAIIVAAVDERLRVKTRNASYIRMHEHPEWVWVAREDSILAGNCPAGTDAWIADMVASPLARAGGIDPAYPPGAVRADVLLAMRDDAYTRRAVEHAATRA